MRDVSSLIPSDAPRPHVWGQRFRAWQELDRATLMAVLALVRERYDEQQRHRIEETGTGLTESERDLERAKLVVLEEIRKRLLAGLASVPDDLFEAVPDGETWSCHDLVNHLAVDENGEFFPGPPDSLTHRIIVDSVHLRQLRRFLWRLGLIDIPEEQGTAV